jgi:hypothetical protein
MLNWITSLISAIILLAAAVALENSTGGLSAWFYAVALILWVLLGYFLNTESAFAEDVSAPEKDRSTTDHPRQPPTDGATHAEAIHQLVKELAQKEELIKNLHAKISEKDFRRSLSRLASINETLHFTLKIRGEGKITDAIAVDQLRMEIESAISDLGLEFDAIVPGQTVAELMAGSFVVVKAEEAPAGAKPGTVKEVLNIGLYARDEAGKKHFISPSKLNVYKL